MKSSAWPEMPAPLDLETIEAVAKLLERYELDSYESEHFTLKKTRHTPKKSADTEVGGLDPALAKHFEPPPDEPWLAVDDKQLEDWSKGGKV